jgi:hypothetical protein
VSEPARFLVPDPVKTVMGRHREVNWSEVCRKAIMEHIRIHLPEEYRGLTK